MRARLHLTSFLLAAFISGAAGANEQSRESAGTGEPEAEEAHRTTVQPRVASKAARPYAHLHLATHLRNDFYDTFAVGLEAGYFLDENLGFSLRVTRVYSSLSPAAVKVRDETGMTPDARPQDLLLAPGAHLSLGYGKALVIGGFLLHFDPQAKLQLGLARADTRWLPTALAGLGILGHLRYGIQVRLDLDLSLQVEKRTRGWIPSLGLLPTLAVGWRLEPGVLR